MRSPLSKAIAALPLLAVAACGLFDGEREDPVAIPDGTFRVVDVVGVPEADRAPLLAITARVVRATGQLVFTLADSSRLTAAMAFRPKSGWERACPTMSSHSLNEVADLSPAPLQLGAVTFATPLVYVYCSPSRLILSDAFSGAGPFLVFDLQ